MKRASSFVLTLFSANARDRRRLELMVGPAGFWKKRQQFMFDFLVRSGLKPHHTLLDIGCGPLSAGLAIIPYLEPGHYTGIDIRESAIAEAHLQIAKAGLAAKNPTLAVSSSFGRDELGDRKVDTVWASAVLYHLEDPQAEQLFDQVTKLLMPGSKFYANVNTDLPGDRWAEFPFVQRPLAFYESLAERYGLGMQNKGTLLELGYPKELPGHRNSMLEFQPVPA